MSGLRVDGQSFGFRARRFEAEAPIAAAEGVLNGLRPDEATWWALGYN
jgi:hypothetical protein